MHHDGDQFLPNVLSTFQIVCYIYFTRIIVYLLKVRAAFIDTAVSLCLYDHFP